MQRAVRNLGREGLAATAISAVDAALHDLKARLLGLPLLRCWAPIGTVFRFTAAAVLPLIRIANCRANLAVGVARGLRFVKMKVGSQPDDERTGHGGQGGDR